MWRYALAKLNEEKELKAITKQFSAAVTTFTKKDYSAAREQFAGIVDSFRESEHYSVLEIVGRSNVYLRMVDAQMNPQKIELKTADDMLSESVYQLNSGQVDRALELLAALAKKQGDDAYTDYLMAVAYNRRGDIKESLDHLKRSIGMDPHYKVMAFNEPDFETLLENKDFRDLVS